MTKKHFVKELYKTVKINEEIGMMEKEILELVSGLLDAVQPKNPAKFSKWGKANQQTTPEDCWKND